MSWMSRFVKDIRSIDKSALSLTTGFRAAAFAIAPIIIGFAIHQPALLLATLGAIFLTNTERAFYTIPSRILLVPCVILIDMCDQFEHEHTCILFSVNVDRYTYGFRNSIF